MIRLKVATSVVFAFEIFLVPTSFSTHYLAVGHSILLVLFLSSD